MTTLSELFKNYSYMLGDEVRQLLEDSQSAQNDAIQAKIDALTGADSQMNTFLDQLRVLLDSDSQSAGYQQGLNIFETIAARVSALNSAIASTNGDVTALGNTITQFGIDLSALLARIVSLEGVTAVLRTDVDAAHTKVDGVITAIAEAAGGIVGYMNELRAGLRGTARPGN